MTGRSAPKQSAEGRRDEADALLLVVTTARLMLARDESMTKAD